MDSTFLKEHAECTNALRAHQPEQSETLYSFQSERLRHLRHAAARLFHSNWNCRKPIPGSLRGATKIHPEMLVVVGVIWSVAFQGCIGNHSLLDILHQPYNTRIWCSCKQQKQHWAGLSFVLVLASSDAWNAHASRLIWLQLDHQIIKQIVWSL